MEPVPLPPQGADQQTGDLPPGTRALAELHTRLKDTIAGFDKVVEKAEPDFLAIAVAFRDMHNSHERAVAEMLVQDGHDPAQDGSIFGTVNRGLIEVRSWFDDIGINMMDALVSGEKHVLESYEQAIEHAAPAERGTALSAMRDAQVALMDRHCAPT